MLQAVFDSGFNFGVVSRDWLLKVGKGWDGTAMWMRMLIYRGVRFGIPVPKDPKRLGTEWGFLFDAAADLKRILIRSLFKQTSRNQSKGLSFQVKI